MNFVRDTPRIYRLDQYVVKRDSRGVPTLIIARESVHASNLPLQTRTAVGLTLDPDKQDQTVDVYTVIEKRGESHAQYQEINGKRVPGSESETPIEKSGWLALRWLAIPANDYGRSHVTEYIGDLLALEELNESMIAYTAITSDIKFFVQPNSVIDLDVVVGSERGSFHTGEAKDISVLSLDKQADFMVAERLASAIEARVAKAFLIQQFRNAERVTAEEIRMSSEELENTLGGTYSVLSAELQYAVATRYLYIAEREDLIPTLPAGIKPKVITGLAALGAAAEVNRVRTWASDVMSLLGQGDKSNLGNLGVNRISSDGNELWLQKAKVTKLKIHEYGINAIGNCDVDGGVFIRSNAPTITFQDSDHRSAMIHVNSNRFYVLRGSGTNSTGWEGTGGGWPLEINLDNNDAYFGGQIYSGNNCWFRVRGSGNGIYWENHGGGLHMSDNDWVRVYNGKNFYCSAQVRANTVVGESDRRLKTNIETITDATQKVEALTGVTFDWKRDGSAGMGFIAQDFEQVIPALVTEDADGMKGVEYGPVVALLVEALKQTNARVAVLEGRV